MSKESCILREIMGASLSSLEYIPLTLYRPYGLSLILWIWSGDLGVEGCRGCPWPEAYEAKESLDLIEIQASSIIERGRRLDIDLIFLHGGEPMYKPWFLCLSETLAKEGISLGVKARFDILLKYGFKEILEARGLNAILIEVPQNIPGSRIESVLTEIMKKALNRNIYIEILVTDLISPLDSDMRDRIKNILEQYRIAIDNLTPSRPIPIGIYAAHLEEHDVLSIRKIIREICVGKATCYIIESNKKIYPDYIKCPTCGVEVARRSDILVIPLITDVKCMSCGSRIFMHSPHRIKRRFPVNTPIYLLPTLH
ncbi:MAG: hypothetical protein QXE01_01850 [Sulfolobales archaeon]